MRFILHEIKLWFKNEKIEPKSYSFLPDKINVVTGDSTTGKTSFWNIIDYCLLSGKVTIANTINDKVLWFGIRFTINGKEISIVRKTPINGAVSSEVFFELDQFPVKPYANKEISEIKSILDIEFGITDALRFPHGKGSGKVPLNLSYRHFLLFNSLTQTIIDAPETYFDTTFYGKEEYDEALSHIFDLVIGINDMAKIKAEERLNEIGAELDKIKGQERTNQNRVKNFEAGVLALYDKCKKHAFIDYLDTFDSINSVISIIQGVVDKTKEVAKNSTLFSEIDGLNNRRKEILTQITIIEQYQKEYDLYKRNLNKSADSLQPIEFLNKRLSDQLVDSYETKLFVESLESSLRNIKDNLSQKITEPLKVTGDINEFRTQLREIDRKISELNLINNSYKAEGEKFIALGEIKYEFEQLLLLKDKLNKPIDSIKLNRLNEEKDRLAKVPDETLQIKSSMIELLNQSVQRIFNLLNSLPTYKGSRVEFNSKKMILQLYPDGHLFPLDNVGSASNYMFMHLCVYLGLHEHVIKIEQDHIPDFLFIDQPSTPYYEGKNDDKAKLIDAFNLLNSFMDYIIVKNKRHFQIFMVEHAPKDYWIENKLMYFHTVDEFIEGKGLIPENAYNS